MLRNRRREAKILAPKIDTELLKQCKESLWTEIPTMVPQSQEDPSQFQSTLQAIKKRMAHQIIEEEHKAEILQQIHEEIEEETEQKAAHKKVLRRYQLTMMAFMLWLDKKELQEA
ncbi:hypothetical protein BDR04DRAFT_1119858 [Suillus decipiens]|nr:hypothetical protein BDR04DRAFT_1119858 [Suillus decipiens]